MLYFEALPGELKLELLKRLPPSMLISTKQINKLWHNDKEWYIFDVDCFKPYDNEQLWQALYNYEYSIEKLSYTSYKDAYIKYKRAEVSKKGQYMVYVAENGLDRVFVRSIASYKTDDFSYSYTEMFDKAVISLQLHFVERLTTCITFLEEAYEIALMRLLNSGFNLDDLAKVESLVELLMKKCKAFPRVSYQNGRAILDRTIIDGYLKHNDGVKFIKFLLKYKAIADEQTFFGHVCSVYDIPLDTVKWCLENMNVKPTKNIFKHISKSNDFVKLFIENGYILTVDDINAYKTHDNFNYLLDMYVDQACKCRKLE